MTLRELPVLPVLPVLAPPEPFQSSPEFVRISMASALALRYRSGKFARDFAFGGINLLLNYEDGCRSDCGYCGLGRSRPGDYDEKSFIRVEWPVVPTDDLVDRVVRYEEQMTRLCISMVTNKHSYPDTLAPTLNEDRLVALRDVGVDMIGFGLDAVTEEVFVRHRKDVPQGGGLKWDQYWRLIHAARRTFGPWKINCHTLVGIGETDRDLMGIFDDLKREQIFSYLFCFNPEPDSRMGDWPKSPLVRWRRIQLAKWLLEENDVPLAEFRFDADGALVGLGGGLALATDAVESGMPFMTNGCPSAGGTPGCSRPYGSYRPSEPFRDFPFKPVGVDIEGIWDDLRLDQLTAP
ncbi:MAG: Radical domain protein [Chloroflexi bacterium]|nr:Radical domain protein [Chloroflexota bacterium]